MVTTGVLAHACSPYQRSFKTLTLPRSTMENTDSQCSLARLMSVLDVIEASSGGLTFEEMLEAMKLSRSTVYRYVMVLAEAGLIVRSAAMSSRRHVWATRWRR
jgi:Fe2+ or Zn2+ uptake regulation protein